MTGGFFGGYSKYRVDISGEGMTYQYDQSPLDRMPEDAKCFEDPFSKEDLLDMLRSLYLGEWKHAYDNYCVFDGTQWELTLTFSNGRRPLKYGGSNAFPWCFNTLTDFFEYE